MKDIFLLDMDETLLDFLKAEEENFLWALHRFGVQTDARTYPRFHEINDGLWKMLERGEIARAEINYRRFELLFQEFGYRADFKAVASAYFKHFEEVCYPYPGAIVFLKALKERGRTYIVTNGSKPIQERHIADAGFLSLIEGAFISEDVGFNKPSKEYADYVKANIEGFENSRAVWIGDSLTSDMVCAQNAQVDFILYSPTGRPQGYGGELARNYDELLQLL
ncbi:MAG: HAD-IA family hydrolase [Clostridia bacterium]|nr:HAD-IA family hydrolase [Clostridia bacterium]